MTGLDVLYAVVAVIGYAFIGGLTWQLTKDRWEELFAFMGAAYWPLIVPVLVVLFVGRLLVLTLPAKLVAAIEARRIPRAVVVERKDVA